MPELIIIANGEEYPAQNLIGDNFKSHNVPEFKSRGRIIKHKWLVYHENAGSHSYGSVVRQALRSKYNYHFIIDRYGTVHQHADAFTKLNHAGRTNNASVGICLVNSYYPENISVFYEQTLPKPHRYSVLNAAWWTHCKSKPRRYVAPTEAQIKACSELTDVLCAILDIPAVYPTANLSKKQRKIKGWPIVKKPAPGIVAHRDFSRHADGRYMLDVQIDARGSH